MKELKDYHKLMHTILGDANNRRYTDDLLDAGLAQALNELNEYLPYQEMVHSSVSRYESGMAILAGYFGPGDKIMEIRRASDGQLMNASVENIGGKTCLRFGRAPLPRIGEDLWLDLGGPQMIKGLEDAECTTVPDRLMMTLASGGAGYALLIRARSVTEVFGKRPEDISAMQHQGERLISDYRSALGDLARRESYHRDPW